MLESSWAGKIGEGIPTRSVDGMCGARKLMLIS